jgi:hypothetical protein
MASSLSETPIFCEALASVAVCSPADAAEHFDAIRSGEYDQTGKVQQFFEQYVAHA